MTYASMMYGVGKVFCAICSEGRSPHLSVHPARLVHPLHPVRPFFPSWDTALHFPDQPPLLHRLSSCTSPLAQGLMAESPSQWPSWLSVREKWTTFERLQWWHSLHPIRLLAQHLFPLAECCRSIWGCIDRWFSRFQHRGWRSWHLCAHENTFHTQTVCSVGGWVCGMGGWVGGMVCDKNNGYQIIKEVSLSVFTLLGWKWDWSAAGLTCYMWQLTLMLKCSTVGADDTVDSKSSSWYSLIPQPLPFALVAGEGGGMSTATASLGGWVAGCLIGGWLAGSG